MQMKKCHFSRTDPFTRREKPLPPSLPLRRGKSARHLDWGLLGMVKISMASPTVTCRHRSGRRGTDGDGFGVMIHVYKRLKTGYIVELQALKWQHFGSKSARGRSSACHWGRGGIAGKMIGTDYSWFMGSMRIHQDDRHVVGEPSRGIFDEFDQFLRGDIRSVMPAYFNDAFCRGVLKQSISGQQ